MAEAMLNGLGGAGLRAHSAGSDPKGEINPGTINLLQTKGYDVAGLRSKSWDEFARPDSPAMDYVITVCNNAAHETQPAFPGSPAKAYWDIPDPPAAADVQAAFEKAYSLLLGHIGRLLAIQRP